MFLVLKPFKITFKNVLNVVMVQNNHMEPNKITLVGWVDQALDQSLTKQNIKYGFGATSIWFCNPKIMDNI
jgi:hypothetical protein